MLILFWLMMAGPGRVTVDHLIRRAFGLRSPAECMPERDERVFDVPGHSGLAIHSGRSRPLSPTNGCIRTTDEATQFLNQLNRSDPLKTLTVSPPEYP
jgi:hypothetical protein